MKILQVVHGFPPRNTAGTEIYTYNLSGELSKRHEVYVFYPIRDTTKRQYSLNRKEYDRLHLIEINNHSSYWKAVNLRFTYKNSGIEEKFATLLDEIKPDVIHFQHLINLSASLVPLSKERGIPVILHLHDFWFMCHRIQLLKDNGEICSGPDETGHDCLDCYANSLLSSWSAKLGVTGNYIKNGAANFVLKELFKLFHRGDVFLQRNTYLKNILEEVDLIVARSNFLRNKFIKHGLAEHKIILSTQGIDAKLFTGFVKKKSEGTRFGFIGGMAQHKGIYVLIEAFNKINHKSAELKIYGDYEPSSRSYKALLGKRINPNIKFMGSYADVKQPFSEIDVLVIPSIWYETGGPYVIFEAFASKTPVIASNIGCIPEFVSNNETGLLFEAGNPTDLYEKMETIIENPGLIERFKINIKPVRTIEDEASKLESIYERLINKESRSAKTVKA